MKSNGRKWLYGSQLALWVTVGFTGRSWMYGAQLAFEGQGSLRPFRTSQIHFELPKSFDQEYNYVTLKPLQL